MTSRLRSITRPRRSTYTHNEDRQQFLVTALFAGVIGLVVVILVAAVALWYYNENLRALARVGAVEIRPELPRARAALLLERIDREEGRLREAQTRGEIDAATMEQRIQELRNEANEIGTLAVEGLIDLIYQSQLAAERGITVTDGDVDNRMADELSSPEKRRVLAIFVEPEASDDEEGPTLEERRAGLERAQEALAAIESGRSWADVAAEYSSDPSGDAGGEYGIVSESGPLDPAWTEALFALPEGGTTGVIAGSDGIYRIGRVTEILPGQEEPVLRDNILERMSLDQYRQFLRYEETAERLREQVVADATTGTVEQLRLAHIAVEGTQPTGDDEADEGEVHYSEIVYAPGDDVVTAPDLPEDDPQWAAAQAEAEATAAELRAITDPEQMAQRFAEIASAESDSPLSAEEGGDAGFVSRGLLPDKVAEALFDTEHQPEELIGPIRDEAGYYVLLFHERRGAPAERLQEVVDALAQPDADFAAIAAKYSDGEEADEGGELGWFSREMLNAELVDKLFALEAGGVSEPIELSDGHHVFKVLEKGQRALDPDQITLLRGNAFERWYDPLKKEAEDQGVIVRHASVQQENLDPGLDQGGDGGLPLDPGGEGELPVEEVDE
ncbi:MAG TPA: peptidylprolyl isomerase [Candidatus Caenarcaniphilales bacterium]|nr:peptidylprolyl isomerase [Candidatus Caenarcaniphilales bacterium]